MSTRTKNPDNCVTKSIEKMEYHRRRYRMTGVRGHTIYMHRSLVPEVKEYIARRMAELRETGLFDPNRLSDDTGQGDK